MTEDYLDHSLGGVATEISSRKRINVGLTASGKLTWDMTVELFNKSNDEVIAEMKDLKEKLKVALGD